MSYPFYQALAKGAGAALSKRSFKELASASPPPLEPFITGGLGNFPYYWQDPSNLLFNIETYNWISVNLKAGAYPIQQTTGSTFTNLFIYALGSVYYSLSCESQNALTEASRHIFERQAQLLLAWETAYGSLPDSGDDEQPIDLIINIIATNWAAPPTTLSDMQNAANLNILLNQVPASGKPIMPILVNYIDALNESDSLQNASPQQTGYLKAAKSAAQNPKLTNGGLRTNNHQILPAYEVSTPLAEILEGLRDSTNNFTIKAKVTLLSDNKVRVELSGAEVFNIHTDDFFMMPTNSEHNLFKSIMEKSREPVEFDITFSGLTMVYFQPVIFNKSTEKDWFWKEPLIDAVQNGNRAMTGFKFAPDPNIDFSKKAPFSFLTGVAISNYPSFDLKMTGSEYQEIADAINYSNYGEVRLMGNRMKSDLSQTVYNYKTKIGCGGNFVTINCSPVPNAKASINSRAWVHGVQVDYPVAIL